MEPRMEIKDEILYQELEEINEILFHERGIINIGYSVDRKERMVLQMNSGVIIGAYYCTFGLKS